MKKQLLTLILLINACLLLNANSAKSQVIINEFSCSNLTQYIDNHSDYNDWIELYNAGATAVNLGGYYLSDDSLNNTKWQMPSTISIGANAYIRI